MGACGRREAPLARKPSTAGARRSVDCGFPAGNRVGRPQTRRPENGDNGGGCDCPRFAGGRGKSVRPVSKRGLTCIGFGDEFPPLWTDPPVVRLTHVIPR